MTMSFAARNSLMLFALILTGLGTGGYYVVVVQTRTLAELTSEDARTRGQLESLRAQMQDYERIDERLLEAETAWKSRTKVIEPREDPTVTFARLNELAALSGGLEFDFTLIENGTEGDLAYNLYQVIGQGPYDAIYNFVRLLDHDVVFRRIEALEVGRADRAEHERGELVMNMLLRAYADPHSSGELPVRELPAPESRLSPFARPAAPASGSVAAAPIRPRPRPNPEGLPVIQGGELIALSAASAVLRTAAGRTVRLRAGDRVHLGRLESIDLDQSSCRFLLDEGQGDREYVLKLARKGSGGSP